MLKLIYKDSKNNVGVQEFDVLSDILKFLREDFSNVPLMIIPPYEKGIPLTRVFEKSRIMTYKVAKRLQDYVYYLYSDKWFWNSKFYDGLYFEITVAAYTISELTET